MNYLIYIEMSAENLQFFLWHRDYVQRFHSATTSDIALAPEWTQEEQNEAFNKLQKEHREGLKRDPAATASIFKGTDFEKSGPMSPSTMDKPSPIFSGNNPFNTPPRTPNGDNMSDFTAQNAMTYRSQANDAFASAGTKAPCKSQETLAACTHIYTSKQATVADSQRNSHHSALPGRNRPCHSNIRDG